MKTKISEMKSIPDIVNSRLDILGKKKNNKCEDIAIEAVQHEKGGENKTEEMKRVSVSYGTASRSPTWIAHASPKGRRKWGTEKIFEVETIKKMSKSNERNSFSTNRAGKIGYPDAKTETGNPNQFFDSYLIP